MKEESLIAPDSQSSADLPALTGELHPAAESASSSDLTVSITATLPPKNGAVYRPGEVITLLITVINHSSENLRELTITEAMSGKQSLHTEILHGGKIPFLASYTVTDEDAERSFIRLEAHASALSRSGSEYNAVPVELTLPASPAVS